MVTYCKTTECLRKYLLVYFGENDVTDCSNCSNCIGEMVQQDITVEAQKILSAVARVEKKYTFGLGVTLIVRMLHGSKEQRVIQMGLDRLPTYGIIIFSNATLSDMAIKRPQSIEEFLQVAGVGEIKAKRYGQAFVEEIRNWIKDKSDG